MGYVILHPAKGQAGQSAILGDEVGVNKAKRDLGLPHHDSNGRYVSAADIKRDENRDW